VHGYDIPYDYCGTAVQQQQQERQQSGQLPAADTSSNGPAAGLGSHNSSSNAAAAAVPLGGRALSGSASGRAVIGSSPSMRLRHLCDPGVGEEVPLLSPSVQIEGAPGARQSVGVCGVNLPMNTTAAAAASVAFCTFSSAACAK
jgi:hypothetical protein